MTKITFSPDSRFCLLESEFLTFTRFFYDVLQFLYRFLKKMCVVIRKRVEVQNFDSSKQNMTSGEGNVHNISDKNFIEGVYRCLEIGSWKFCFDCDRIFLRFGILAYSVPHPG